MAKKFKAIDLGLLVDMLRPRGYGLVAWYEQYNETFRAVLGIVDSDGELVDRGTPFPCEILLRLNDIMESGLKESIDSQQRVMSDRFKALDSKLTVKVKPQI